MKRLYLSFYLPFLIIGLIGSSCDSTSSEENSNSQAPLIPLQVGNSWNFQSSDGEEYASLTVEGTRIVNDVEYYEIVIEWPEYEDESVFVTNKEEGVYLGQGTPFAEFPLKYPVEEGEIYTHTDVDGNEYNITVTKKSVETPAGNFSCFQYDIEIPTYGLGGSTVCISPGVGPIRFEEFNVLGSYSIQ